MEGKIIVPSKQVIELGERNLVQEFSTVTCLPEEIRALIGDPQTFKDARVIAYTVGQSQICLILYKNPADDWMLRIVYYDDPSNPKTTGLDFFLSQSLSGQALRDRLHICSTWLAREFVKRNKKIVDLGGGSGSYFFEMLKHIPVIPSGFHWHVIDLDEVATQAGLVKAQERKLQDYIDFSVSSFTRKNELPGNDEERADYAVLIGVLCGMDEKTAVNCLRSAREHVKDGGEILAATLLQSSFDEDPCTFRILCNVGGWQLRPKSKETVIKIFEDAGWKIRKVMSERPEDRQKFPGDGQYAIVHAIKI